MTVFTYALKAAESKRQYPRRLKIFLDYLELEGNLQQQAEQFYLEAIGNHAWVEESLMSFIAYEKERSKNGEISDSTIPNYYRATKLFCEMNDITLNWKKIARGLPRAGKDQRSCYLHFMHAGRYFQDIIGLIKHLGSCYGRNPLYQKVALALAWIQATF
jgi:hypothetical protein